MWQDIIRETNRVRGKVDDNQGKVRKGLDINKAGNYMYKPESLMSLGGIPIVRRSQSRRQSSYCI
jgi:hypothetical protein